METYATPCWERLLGNIRNKLNSGNKNFKSWEAIQKSQCLNDEQPTKYLDMFENKICKLKQLDYIFEFGPGHGRVCKLIHERGFCGTYVCFDFPEMIKIQKMFLDEIKPTYISNTNEVSPPNGKSLFISMSALEEAPMDIHDWFFNYAKQYNCWLFKFSGRKRKFDEYMPDCHWIARNDFFGRSVYLRYGVNNER